MMGSHGRRSGKLLFDSFRSCSWRVMPKPQILLPNTRFSQHEHFLLMSAWNRVKFHAGISTNSLLSRPLGLQDRANRNLCNPFLNETRRFYYMNQYNNVQQHRKSRGLRWWFRVGVLIVTWCSGVIVTTYSDHLEIIPYNSRTRLILFSESKLRRRSEKSFNKKKASFEGRILPNAHLESMRVRRIAHDIINALPNKRKCKDSEDDGKRRGLQLSTSHLDTSHLDELDWEVLVVSGFGHPFAVECGKIVVFDWMLEHVTSDAEIAFLVGREIGHIVARHYAEAVTKAFCIKILKSILNPIGLWDSFRKEYAIPVLRILWKLEFEADFIGIILCASAGYDPREAPKFLERIDKFWTPNSVFLPPEIRAKFLSLPAIMWQPLSIYLRGCIK